LFTAELTGYHGIDISRAIALSSPEFLPPQQTRSDQPGWNFHLNINPQRSPNLTSISAWYYNCQLLRISVCHSVPARSPICSPDIPQSLQPTATQLLYVHPLGIDGFPFPTLRDNLIRLGGLFFDEEDFTRDIYYNAGRDTVGPEGVEDRKGVCRQMGISL
jgi:hypothetical protein